METPVTKPHVRVHGDGERIVLVHGSNIASPELLWSAQLELSSHYQVVISDRRGYGANPEGCDKGGYDENVRDIVALLDQGAHLVAHSYGGVLAMVAATRCPERVKSLVVIEPPAFGVTIHDPDVARVVEELESVYASADQPEDFLAGFLRALGTRVMEPLHLSPVHRRAVMATMAELAPWKIGLELDRLASCAFPKLVVSGDWHPALMVTAAALAEQLRAQRLVIHGVGHEIQKMGRLFNERLKALIQLAAT